MTINNIDIIREMNNSKLNIDPETGEETKHETIPINNH